MTLRKIILSTVAFVMLFSTPALASPDIRWQTWLAGLGWGSLVIFVLCLLGKITELTIKEVAPVLIKRVFKIPSEKKAFDKPGALTSRRNFFRHCSNLGIVALSGFATFKGLKEGLSFPNLKEVPIKINGLHPDLEEFDIVQISDLHLFPTTSREWVQDIVEQTNALSPDIIAFTGDTVDADYQQLQHIITPLAQLKSKHGNYFVSGNHEYMVGINGWLSRMQKLGFIVLQNENRLVSKGSGTVLIGGVADYSAPFRGTHESSPAKAKSANLNVDYSILLAHQPRSIYEAAQVGFDLQLSGHTHGGLLCSTRWLASLAQPFQSGLYRYKNTQIYVSNGAGYWGIPLRSNTPSEITHVKLMPG